MSVPESSKFFELHVDVAACAVDRGRLQVLTLNGVGDQAEEFTLPTDVLLKNEPITGDDLARMAVRSVLGDHVPVVLEELDSSVAPGMNQLRVGYLAVPRIVDVPFALAMGAQWRDAHDLATGTHQAAGLVGQAIGQLRHHVKYGLSRNVDDLSPLAVFLPPEMTVTDLRMVAEAILDEELPAANFDRTVRASVIHEHNLRSAEGAFRQGPRGIPAQVYRYTPRTNSVWPPEAR